MIDVIKNSIGHIVYDPEKKYYDMVWYGRVSVEPAMECFKAMLRFAEDNKVNGGISNVQGLIGTFTMVNDYLTREWFPTICGRGYAHHAQVVGREVFVRFSSSQMVERTPFLESRLFDDYDTGLSWLLENLKVEA